MIKKTMTEIDHAVYNFIVDYITANGYAPSYREIAKGCYICSTSDVVRYLNKLQSMRKIVMKDKTPRAIKVVGYEFMKVG